ncbi:hypothetical protein [Sphingomonas sp. MS122]|uniref:hypothetical protein n=1 Tax=Sphingomonas sp. MS122 TaxID=3412683 RepID=UPI003C2DAC72
MTIIASILALLQATAAPDAADPLAPAREGKLQCTLPDPVKKSCMALSRYVPDGDRRYLNITRSLMGKKPEMILEFKSPTVIEGNAACGIMARSEMDEAIIYVDGIEAPVEVRKPITDSLLAQVEGHLGKKACQRIRRDGDGLVQEVEIDGQPTPENTMRVSWVDPTEGYRLRMGLEPD